MDQPPPPEETPVETAASAASTESLPVGWLELFFDLVFVVVVAQVALLIRGDPSWQSMLATLGLVLVVWSTWFNGVAYSNIARGIARPDRIWVLASMAGVAVMAVGIPDLAGGSPLTFVTGIAIARCALAPLWVRQRRRHGLTAAFAFVQGPLIAAAWLVSALLPPPWIWVVWAALVVTQVLAARPGDDRLLGHYDSGHMLERVSAFVMICFGEAVAQLAGSLIGTHDAERWWLAFLAFVLLASMFWTFYDVTLDRIGHAVEGAPDSVAEFLGFSQILVVAGIIGVAAGVAGAVEAAGSPELSPGGLVTLAGGVALFMIGTSTLSMEAMRVLFRNRREAWRIPVTTRWRRAVALLVVVSLLQAMAVPVLVILFGAHLPPWLVVALLAATPIGSVATSLWRTRQMKKRRPAPPAGG